MNWKSFGLLCLFLTMFCCPESGVFAAEVETSRIDYDTFEIDYATGNSDWKQYRHGGGYSLILNKDLIWNTFLMAAYTREEFRIGGPIQGRELSDWIAVGPAWRWEVHPRFHLVTAATWQRAVLDDENEDGYGLHVGFRSRPFDRLEINFLIGYLDLVIEDVQAIGEVYLQLLPWLDLGARVRDYADWDYTSYEGGLRFHF